MGLGGMVAQGMAFGAGSAITHQAVGGIARSMTGGDNSETSQDNHTGGAGDHSQFDGQVCGTNQKKLYECLNSNDGDAARCQWFFDSLKECQDQAKYGQNIQ